MSSAAVSFILASKVAGVIASMSASNFATSAASCSPVTYSAASGIVNVAGSPGIRPSCDSTAAGSNTFHTSTTLSFSKRMMNAPGTITLLLVAAVLSSTRLRETKPLGWVRGAPHLARSSRFEGVRTSGAAFETGRTGSRTLVGVLISRKVGWRAQGCVRARGWARRVASGVLRRLDRAVSSPRVGPLRCRSSDRRGWPPGWR